MMKCFTKRKIFGSLIVFCFIATNCLYAQWACRPLKAGGAMTCGWGCYTNHKGEDWNYGSNDYGDPIYSVAAGKVMKVVSMYSLCDDPFIAGGLDFQQPSNYIMIKHTNGFFTRYGHISGVASGISVGTMVCKGQLIAYIGNVGPISPCNNSNPNVGAHLHFEVGTSISGNFLNGRFDPNYPGGIYDGTIPPIVCGGNTPPTNLSVTTPSCNNPNVTFNWTNSASNWNIDVTTNSGWSSWDVKFGVNGTSETGPAGFSGGLTFQAGLTYYWRIYNGTTFTYGPSFTVPNCGDPPTNLQVTPDCSGTVNFNWTNSGTGWLVDVSTDAGFSFYYNKDVSTQTATTSPSGFACDIGFAPCTPNTLSFQTGITYYWRIWDGTTHTYGSSFTIPACVGVPEGLQATPDCFGNVNFSWNNSGDDWYVDVSTDGGFGFYYNKNVSNQTATTSPSGFACDIGNAPCTPNTLSFQTGITYYWRIWDGTTHTYGSSFTIPIPPTVSFLSTNPKCTAFPIDFTNTGSSGSEFSYYWDFGTNASPPNSSSENQSVTYSANGTKTVSLTITNTTNGCSATETQTIYINQTPTASYTHTAPVCAGSPVSFTNTGSTGTNFSYSWNFGPGAVPANALSENPTGVVYATSGNKTVTFTIFSGYCVQTVTQTITIFDAPIASFSSTAPQCTGLNVDFTNTGTVTGTAWSWNFGTGATPATSSAQTPTGIVYASAGTKVVTLTTTNTTTGCSVTASQTININQTPTASFTSTVSTCAGSAMNFTNTGSSGGNWSYLWDLGQDAIPGTSISQNPTGVVYSTSGNKIITFTIVDGICTKTSTNTITILNTPKASFSSTAPQCTGINVDFTNTGTVTGTTWVWNFGAGATPATSTVQTPTGIVYATAGTKVISLTTTNTTTGCVDTKIQTINITQTPTASFTSTAPMCAESAVNLSNTGSTGGNWSYFWDLGQDAIPATSISENPIGVVYSAGGNKTVTLTIADASCTQTSTQTISIYSLPIANAGLDTTICANTSVQIGSTTITGNTYSWFPASTLNNSTIANPVANPLASVTQYDVTLSNSITGCVSTDTMIVTMLDPLIAYAGVDGKICRYDSIQIGAGLVMGQIYLWTQSTGLSGTTISNPIASPDSTTTYTVTVTRAGCTLVSDDVTIIVHPLPLANAGTDDTITLGSSVLLNATGGIQYSWSPEYGLSNIGIYNPIANPDTTMEYLVNVTDVHGCVNSDTVTITVIVPAFWVPSAFTPNGDGKSDIFIVRGSGIRNFEFGIFNRWGEQIFYSKDLNTGWDGTNQTTGDKQPEGAYVYYVKGITRTGNLIDGKGMINLIR